jgi:hypothetical protein
MSRRQAAFQAFSRTRGATLQAQPDYRRQPLSDRASRKGPTQPPRKSVVNRVRDMLLAQGIDPDDKPTDFEGRIVRIALHQGVKIADLEEEVAELKSRGR